MLKARAAVLITGGGTNLQAIIDAEKAGLIKHGEIAVVVSSNSTAYGLIRAKNAGIPTEVVNPREFPSHEAFEAKLLQVLHQYSVEMIALAGYLCILSEDFVREYPDRILNVHPSLIPSFCGAGFFGLHVHEAALKRGVKLTGATVHYVNETIDGGRILLQKAVPVRKGDTPEILQRRVMEQAEWRILPRAVELVCRDILKAKKEVSQ